MGGFYPGVHGAVDPHRSISNSVVKRSSGDDSWGVAPCENSSMPGKTFARYRSDCTKGQSCPKSHSYGGGFFVGKTGIGGSPCGRLTCGRLPCGRLGCVRCAVSGYAAVGGQRLAPGFAAAVFSAVWAAVLVASLPAPLPSLRRRKWLYAGIRDNPGSCSGPVNPAGPWVLIDGGAVWHQGLWMVDGLLQHL